jgi:hypothetical protein
MMPRSRRSRSSIWPQAVSFARPVTFCGWGRRVWARVIWCKRLATMP